MKVDAGHSCQCVGRDSLRPTVGGNAKPRGLSEAGTLDGNEPGHLSEDCNTAGSQPDLMQWVNVTDLARDAS